MIALELSTPTAVASAVSLFLFFFYLFKNVLSLVSFFYVLSLMTDSSVYRTSSGDSHFWKTGPRGKSAFLQLCIRPIRMVRWILTPNSPARVPRIIKLLFSAIAREGRMLPEI